VLLALLLVCVWAGICADRLGHWPPAEAPMTRIDGEDR
jgi:hypothetical protein